LLAACYISFHNYPCWGNLPLLSNDVETWHYSFHISVCPQGHCWKLVVTDGEYEQLNWYRQHPSHVGLTWSCLLGVTVHWVWCESSLLQQAVPRHWALTHIRIQIAFDDHPSHHWVGIGFQIIGGTVMVLDSQFYGQECPQISSKVAIPISDIVI
jgi:hypothetical protein